MQVTRRRRALLVAASALYAAGVWWMTLRPTIYDENVGGILHAILRAARGWPPTAWITFDGVEFTANVVMFAPLGVLVLLWGGRWWHGIAAGLLISSAIETTQLLFLPHPRRRRARRDREHLGSGDRRRPDGRCRLARSSLSGFP
ncbi:glycopeptide antibiotics resistance protein [Microbacterium testaceum]|uniref:VanZ family protein n=1 Tax=Microbacterium testaceum TaxID=2033 RepID=UPI0027881A0F|nr:VanZ family protein [Microbacterium testaceum]MDQ1116679.1 glycopeptide antibiotics resistance protein [Microbacterium testaceum]